MKQPWVSYLAGLAAVLVVAAGLRLPRVEGTFDVHGFGRIPVLVNGRIKPMDTVARSSLLVLQGRQGVRTPDGRKLEPTEWLLDVLFQPEKADAYRHFLVDNQDVLALFGNPAELSAAEGGGLERYFSFNQLSGGLAEIDRQAQAASDIEHALRSPFQREVVKLHHRLFYYSRLKYSLQIPDKGDFLEQLHHFEESRETGMAALRARMAGEPHSVEDLQTLAHHASLFELMENRASLLPIPASAEDGATEWRTMGRVIRESLHRGPINPRVMALANLGRTYRDNRPEEFNRIVAGYREDLKSLPAGQVRRTNLEFSFNHLQPFYKSMVLYVGVFLLAAFSWLTRPQLLGRAAYSILIVAFCATTLGIAIRMYLEGRPPVTNLYSSAIFVGWGCVGLGVLLEKIYRNGIGSITAAATGFLSLLIAHHLSLVGGTGDTLEMLRAVLDTNFWLATHVVVITMGYSAMFLAGFLAIVYVLRGFLTTSLDAETGKSLARMVYGIICFATLFNLLGTVLGGIWADQSWGRFWGWDPKENGALLIVLWGAIILHARWGGMVRDQGLMVLAIFGNVVTAWSWFGTNMLGVGLHSYGFMEQGFFWLSTFAGSQLLIMFIGSLSKHRWRSFKIRAVPQTPRPAAAAG